MGDQAGQPGRCRHDHQADGNSEPGTASDHVVDHHGQRGQCRRDREEEDEFEQHLVLRCHSAGHSR